MDEEFARYLLALLPRYFGTLPAATIAHFSGLLRRMHVVSGKVLLRQGEAPDCMYFIVTGRVEAWRQNAHGDRQLVAHRSSGDCVGELSLLTDEPQAADVVVTRDTVLARLARTDYQAMLRSHPEVGLDIARFALRSMSGGAADSMVRIRNIALVPLHPAVPLAEFGRRLELALLRFGSTAYLDSHVALANRAARADRANESDLFLDHLLDEAEKARRFVVCQADAEPTEWTRKCITHADRVLLISAASAPSRLTEIEAALFDPALGTELVEKELVLLHPSRRVPPAETAAWLASRKPYRHSHVSWDDNADFNRLARLLSGNAVTLVLGGGGARGLAQIGAVRAIREAGVPIDAVGGTSVGAIIGALVAFNWDDERILQSCKRAFVDDRPLDDMTIPMFSLLSGKKLSRTLSHYIGEIDIVDLWQPYFCVSSNLSRSCVNVHRSGSLWQAMQASSSLPGLLPPVVMGGDLLVDGGVLDNLPVGIMKRFIGGRTIAVEPAVKVEYSVDEPTFPSALKYLRSRLTQQQRDIALPTLPDLLIKSTLLGGIGGRAELREGADLYLNPPMRDFRFLDWDAIYEIVEVGYRYTQERLVPWLEGKAGLPARDDLSWARVP
jgi:predicted acylesterase/phospholipase RssA/CRP-like cAMP-binding protein